jgi:hypothetical protein
VRGACRRSNLLVTESDSLSSRRPKALPSWEEALPSQLRISSSKLPVVLYIREDETA